MAYVVRARAWWFGVLVHARVPSDGDSDSSSSDESSDESDADDTAPPTEQDISSITKLIAAASRGSMSAGMEGMHPDVMQTPMGMGMPPLGGDMPEGEMCTHA